MKLQMYVLMLLMILMANSFLFSGGDAEKERGEKSGGILIFGRSGDSVGLDPARETDGESFYASEQIFEGLVRFVPGTTKVEPALAVSWDISDDGLTYTFNLRKDVVFHDGSAFNADAVLFTFLRQMDEQHPYFQYGPWKYWGYMDMSNIVDSITAKDEYTVVFTLQKPEAPFLNNLAMSFAGIVSPSAAQASLDDFKNQPVGTGPFVFETWLRDDSITFSRNENYWGRKAYLDKLILKVIPDATARYLALRKGEVDVIDFPSSDDIAKMEKEEGIKLIHQEGLNVGYLAFNVEKKPFDNVLVRRALNHAVNKQEIIDAVYGSQGKPAKNPLPPTIWSYNDTIADYPYDPQKARDLLAEAGHADGFTTDIWAMPVARPYNPNGRRVAEILQAQFAEVGVEAEIISYDWGTYLEKTELGEHSSAQLGWTGDNGDPDNFLWVLLSTPAAEKPAGNIAFWRNEEFTDLLRKAKTSSSIEDRTRLYEEAQVIFNAEVPWIPIAHSVVTVPMRENVMDFVIYPTGLRIFKDVWIKK